MIFAACNRCRKGPEAEDILGIEGRRPKVRTVEKSSLWQNRSAEHECMSHKARRYDRCDRSLNRKASLLLGLPTSSSASFGSAPYYRIKDWKRSERPRCPAPVASQNPNPENSHSSQSCRSPASASDPSPNSPSQSETQISSRRHHDSHESKTQSDTLCRRRDAFLPT